MDEKRFLSPATSALNILEEYHNEVKERLKAYGLREEIQNEIITDIYAKDDIYFSLNRTYECIRLNFKEFCAEHKLHISLPEMLPFLTVPGKFLYAHQAQAIESIISEKITIISTGTGSGKTESFLIPILQYCLEQISKPNPLPGIKAIIIYPLNALANDQVRRIVKALKDRNIRVGCFVGSTPKTKLRKPTDIKELCISRQEMIECPPDILITNYVMLDRLITKPHTRSMFIQLAQTLKYLVVDEVHYFRGTKGTNLSLLLRRLRALYQHPLIQIGASGTLRRGGGYFPDSKMDSIEQFARLIFGHEAVTQNGLSLIEPIFKQEEVVDSRISLPPTETITGNPFLAKLANSEVQALCSQLFGQEVFEEYRKTSGNDRRVAKTPEYRLALQSNFIKKMRDKLLDTPQTFNNLVEMFCQLYKEVYHREPSNPRQVVEAYWSLINYLNYRCGDANIPLILDYRLHLILGNVGDALTRCLLCKRFHDGRCPRCRFCGNGLLFNVSKERPDLCIAFLAGQEIFTSPPPGLRNFPVLVQLSTELVGNSEHILQSLLSLEPSQNAFTKEECYLIRPAREGEEGVLLLLSENKSQLDLIPLSEPRQYWHSVLKVADALVTQPQKDKLLGFIDNRERASSIKLRLNDEIADRALTFWAAEKWMDEGKITLVQAFTFLQNEIPSCDDMADEEEDNAILSCYHEMHFWFARMLTNLDEYDAWNVSIDKSLQVTTDEYELLNDIMLRIGAIDRNKFWKEEIEVLRHFFLEKYRVTTQYGVGLVSASEQGYYVLSLGDQGRLYEEFIGRVQSANIKKMLDTLTERSVLIKKETPGGTIFYQIRPEHILLESNRELQRNGKKFVTVECHTADHSDELRTEIEAQFIQNKVQILICTPTLEMGVDIGELSNVMLIGFPPSPANYAQRAGRAGRSSKSRLATIVVLSSPEDAHDEYYYAVPYKMIDGAITPPQFTLVNFVLLTAHIYAHIVGEEGTSILANGAKLEKCIKDFLRRDVLQLKSELGNSFAHFEAFLLRKCQELAKRLQNAHDLSIDTCYSQGIFPDYGFRRDGLPLVKQDTLSIDEDNVLTTREPEGAPRKLVPGRIVFCTGKAVKVAVEQPSNTYELHTDPEYKAFRAYKYVVAEAKDVVQLAKNRDPESLYRVSRFLDVRQPLETLECQGPLFCRVYYVHQGELYFINEGEMRQNKLIPLQDHRGDYRYGTYLKRDGLLVRFATHILPQYMAINFLAALLRGIPDYFDLDDSEIRVVQNLKLYPSSESLQGKWESFFIYGQDESGLVPFERVFERLETMLKKVLQTLRTCVCGGEGCYLCLHSLNSRFLTGRISHQGASDALSVYLREILLKPNMMPVKDNIKLPDIILTLSVTPNCCRIQIEDTISNKHEKYRRENISEDQNTKIYMSLDEVLKRKREEGAKTVLIQCSLDYIRQQLKMENEVKNGREAFRQLYLELLNWHSWSVERG